MNVNQDELAKLTAMLNSYKQKHGTIAMSDSPNMNYVCGATCTISCDSYCDGSRCFCWKSWKGNG